MRVLFALLWPEQPLKYMSFYFRFAFLFFPTVRNLGLDPVGEDTGTADVLSRVIIESMVLSFQLALIENIIYDLSDN